ncbi:MAG: alpha/beta fold hydrolase [Parvibaculum sp.]|uniref:alpha/beta fold hydrolase n=1 Tax=Parvibaculum sp. TaxID=2024848 RepID=UPI0025FC2C37|nr:alpha/beta hydrolase [Parvibaculum sp.]MCE9651166.1 alpha/beta fold hydrolase [Parvibaculum sp.]
MTQQQIKANGITINYEDRGPADGIPILFVNGYTSTMMSWPSELMDGMKARGFRVIRYDNRDVGKSEKLKGLPDMREIIAAVRAGLTPELPYTLADMAADGIGVLDALGIGRAHVMGISMGGMIVQRMAIHHADRLISATSIMSTTGNPDLPKASDAAMAALQAQPPAEDRETIIRHRMKARRVYQSPAYPRTDEALYELVAREYDHMYYPEGGIRQYAAIGCDGSRVEQLNKVHVPFLVIHGKADPLVPVEGGIDTAKSVPGAKLELIEGMGHDLPVELCPRYVDLIAAHALSAQQKAAAE